MRPKKTTVKKCGKRSFEITFSQKDGEALAKRIREGGSLSDILGDILPSKSQPSNDNAHSSRVSAAKEG